jgi:hypothetical protein
MIKKNQTWLKTQNRAAPDMIIRMLDARKLHFEILDGKKNKTAD